MSVIYKMLMIIRTTLTAKEAYTGGRNHIGRQLSLPLTIEGWKGLSMVK